MTTTPGWGPALSGRATYEAPTVSVLMFPDLLARTSRVDTTLPGQTRAAHGPASFTDRRPGGPGSPRSKAGTGALVQCQHGPSRSVTKASNHACWAERAVCCQTLKTTSTRSRTYSRSN